MLHVVYVDTKFGAARFVSSEATKDIWRTFIDIWVSTHVGNPDGVPFNRGPQFANTLWKGLLHNHDIKAHLSGVESHNSLGFKERYQGFLLAVYLKAREDDADIDKEHSMSLVLKSVNDTAGPNGLVPTLLVFGTISRLPTSPTDLPTQRQRIIQMFMAPREMSWIAAQSRLDTSLRRNVPIEANA